MSFASLKKNSSAALDKLTTELAKTNSNKSYEEDDRFWKLTQDKAGNGSAVIRFLPAVEGEDIPWVKLFSHAFKGPTGKWYIENSLTTIGQNDPVSEHNSKLWDTGLESNKEIVRTQKRKLSFISNIYVVSDPANKDNEGKVFLFKYGKKIFDKINELMNPTFEGDAKVNPFDLWAGANFRLRMARVDRFPNYDKSVFEAPEPLLKDDKELERVWKSQYPLQPFLAPDQFKGYDELKAHLYRVLGLGQGSATAVDEDETPFVAPAKVAVAAKVAEAAPVAFEDDDDDAFKAFQELAEKA